MDATRRVMTFRDSEAETVLRSRLRNLISTEVPPHFAGAFVPGTRGQEQANAFCRRLARERLLTPAWPRDHGGSDADVWEQTAMREEFWAHGEPRGAQYMGVNWVGPAIMHFGTRAQQDEHLPRIAAGEAVWCQGFSEPESGSDLASLRLSASVDGDGFRANGQKIWTSYAGLADWCFLATRTSSAGAKQFGITIFLVPMERPGIEVRPIESILGPHHLNEVFFDDVRLERSDILGQLDHGWDVMKIVLVFERVGIARYARSQRILRDLWPLLAGRDDPATQALREEHARCLVQARIVRLLSYRCLAGGATPLEPAAARIAVTLLDQRVAELAMQVLGPDALDDSPDTPLGGSVEHAWRYARSSTIASGTTEIQRLLVTRSMLGKV